MEGAQTSPPDDGSCRGEENLFSALLGIVHHAMPSDSRISGPRMPAMGDSAGLFLNTVRETAPQSGAPTNPLIAKETPLLQTGFRIAAEEVSFFKPGAAIEAQWENMPGQPGRDAEGEAIRADLLSISKMNARGAKDILCDLPVEETADDFGAKLEKRDMNFKDISQKFMALEKDSTNIKPVEFGSLKSDDSNSFLNGQSQTATDIFESKQGAVHLPKSFQTNMLTQIVERAVLKLRNGQTEIKIHLKPEFLGHLRMQISTDNQQVMLKMLTDVPIAKEIIEGNIHHLRAALQSHGLEMEEIDVCVSHDANHSGGDSWNHEFQPSEAGLERHGEMNGLLPEDQTEAVRIGSESKGSTAIDFFA